MATPDKRPPKKHFVKIPNDISEMSDAQIDAWAKQAHSQLMAQLKTETLKEESEENP